MCLWLLFFFLSRRCIFFVVIGDFPLFIICFVFSILLKAVYEKPVLDLSPTQISSLTTYILCELSSSVEDWCRRKGTPWMFFFPRRRGSSVQGFYNQEIFNSVNLGPTVIGASCCGHPALTQQLFIFCFTLFCSVYSFNFEGGLIK